MCVCVLLISSGNMTSELGGKRSVYWTKHKKFLRMEFSFNNREEFRFHSDSAGSSAALTNVSPKATRTQGCSCDGNLSAL